MMIFILVVIPVCIGAFGIAAVLLTMKNESEDGNDDNREVH